MGCSIVDPSAACIWSVVSAKIERMLAVAIVDITKNIRNMTIATNNQENGLVLGSATIRPNFSSIKIYYAGSQRMPDRVQHNPKHRLRASDERMAPTAPRLLGVANCP